MDRDTLQHGICNIVCEINDIDILVKILTYVNRMILK